jgi:insecticidal toxin complex protein TccC
MTNVHARTPDIVAVDGRGLPVRQIGYLRSQASAPAVALIARQHFDGAGRLAEQWDPRLFGHAPRPNQSMIYDLQGEPLHIDSVDAGWRLILPGLAGTPLLHWDARGNRWRVHHDSQLRPVALDENSDLNVETFTYGDAAQDAGHNLRGQLLEQVDPSGTLRCDSYGLAGLPLRQARTFTDSSVHATERILDAFGAPVSQTDAGGHRQHLRLDVAGQLKAVDLQLKLDAAPQPIMLAAHYNAAGQIERQDTANGVSSRWVHDPVDGRLCTFQAGKPGADLRQDLTYLYDLVGNVVRIDDRTVATVHFANQRVDGHREFTYDSLYRLVGASGFEGQAPHLQPGLPTPIIPIDPGPRFNYSQQYEYDSGNNLTRLRHIRDGNNHTRIMRIDPNSNRGMRWAGGDPNPDFDTLFDAHGNQLFLQAGTPPLAWNSRDQLSRVTMIKRDSGLGDDEETYLYSQGERVGKTHTTITTVQETRYLDGLELHTSNGGEILHVISLELAYGSVRCLHWEAGQPGGIEADQLRYSLDEPHGSCTFELDRHGELISLEFYYPFGGTAWRAGRSLIEVGYKTIRYSGKELDASGLYYFGARYYAPWLQRWISADPAGDVDGLNLYGFVANNPTTYADDGGLMRLLKVETPAQRDMRKAAAKERQLQHNAKLKLSIGVARFTDILKMSTRRAIDAQTQLANHRSGSALFRSSTRRIGSHLAAQGASYGVGIGMGIAGAAFGSVAGPGGTALGAIIGFTVTKAVSIGLDYALENAGIGASVKFKSKKLDPIRIVKKGEYHVMDSLEYVRKKGADLINATASPTKKGLWKLTKEGVNTGTSTALKASATAGGSEISAMVKTAMGAIEIVHEIIGAGRALTEEKIDLADQYINGLINLLNEEMAVVDKLFDDAGLEAINTYVPLEKMVGPSNGITRRGLRSGMEAAIGHLKQTQSMLM